MTEERMILVGLVLTTATFSVLVVAGYFSGIHTGMEVKAVHFSPQTVTYLGWWFVEVWFTLALVHFYCALFRKNRHGRVLCNPTIFSVCPAIFLSVSFTFNVVWMILWKKKVHMLANIFLTSSVSNWAALASYSKKLFTRNEYLHHRARSDLWFYRILGQNSLGLLATWTTIMAVINFGTISVLYYGIDEMVVGVGMASVLTFLLSSYLPAELFLFEKRVRYLISPYIGLLWVSGGVLLRGGGDQTCLIYSIVLLVLSGLALMFRTLASLVLHFYRPLSWSVFRSQLP